MASSSAAARQCAAPANLERDTASATPTRLAAVSRRLGNVPGNFNPSRFFSSSVSSSPSVADEEEENSASRAALAPSFRKDATTTEERLFSNDDAIASATAKDVTQAEVSDAEARSASLTFSRRAFF